MPTQRTLLELARLTGRSPNDPVLVELFDHLVVRGHWVPFVPGWWELSRWHSGAVEKFAQGVADSRSGESQCAAPE
jgi:hypothetical protein